MAARHHRELEVWQLADEIRRRVAAIVRRPELAGGEWQWLRVQLRKAANSGCTNAAEGFGRFYPKDFARFMQISRSSINEIGEHLLEPEVVRVVPAPELAELNALIERSIKASTSLIRYLLHANPPKPSRATRRRNEPENP